MHLLAPEILPSLYLILSCISSVAFASDKSEATRKPCTLVSPTTGSYFDLNVISLSPPKTKDGKKARRSDREESWHARGHDYPANFTMNICAPVIEPLKDVVGVEKNKWQNVSAYYELNGKVYSIGYV